MKRVTLTREAPRNDVLLRRLAPFCYVAEVPLTATRFVDDADITAELRALSLEPRTLVATSARSAHATAIARHTFPNAVVVAVGRTTSEALQAAGCPDVVVSPEASASSVATMDLAGPVLSIGAKAPRPELGEGLNARGITHAHLVAYETVERVCSATELQRLAESDVVVIAAPSAWRVAAPHIGSNILVVAIGATTANEVRKTHNLVTVASEVDDIVAAAI